MKEPGTKKIVSDLESGTAMTQYRVKALADALGKAGAEIIQTTKKGGRELVLSPEQAAEIKSCIGNLDTPDARSRCREFLAQIALMLGDPRLLLAVSQDARHDQMRADALEICKQKLNEHMLPDNVVQDIFPANKNKATDGVETDAVEATWREIAGEPIGQA